MTSVENVVCVVSALEESKCSDWQSMEDDYDLHSRWLTQAIQACKAKIAESYGLPIEAIESELNSPTIPINHDDNKETLPESIPEETTSSSPSSEQEVVPPAEPTLTKGDVMAMKVAELREELLCRGMATSGLKKDLQGRLLEVVLEEQELYLVAVEQQRQIQLEREEEELMEQQQMDKEKEREVETQEAEENMVKVVDVDVVQEDDVKMDTVEEQTTADVDMDDVIESNQYADEYPHLEESTENHVTDEYPTTTYTTDHEDASHEPRPSTEPTNASKHDDQDVSMENAEANGAPTDDSYPSKKSNPSPIDTNIPTESTTTITATAITESKPMDTDVNMNETAEALKQQQQSQPKEKARLGKKIIKLFSPKRKDKHGFTSPKSIHNKANNKKSPKYSPKNTTTATRNHEIIQGKEGTTTTNSSPYKRDSIICPMNTAEIKEVHSSATASNTTQHKNDNKSTNTDSTTNNSLQSKPLKTSTESTATATSTSSSINSQSVPPKLKAYKEARQARLAEIRGKVTSAKKPTATSTAGTGKSTTTASTSTNSTTSTTASTTTTNTTTTAAKSDKGERKRALAAQMRQKAAAEVVTKKTAFTSKSTLKPTPSKPTATEGDDRIMDVHVPSSTNTADVVSEGVPTKSFTMTTSTPFHTSHTSHKTIHSTNTKSKSATTTINTTAAATTPSTHATHLGQAAANALLKKKVLSPMDTYEMSDRDGSSDEESEDEYEKSPKKKIPKWAHKANLIPALEKQYLPGPNRIDPDEIFPEVSTCDLEAIFDQKKKRYTKRTSSGNWTNDCVTVPERMVYKRNMGFQK